MSNQYIELTKLVKSPFNVRKTDSRAACEELKASILAHGLMQNLVVVPSGDGYHVIAGARRLAALKALQAESKLPAAHAVPCQVVTEQHALEMSLAENTVRAAMHPADEYEAFARLADAGQSPEQIATNFGTSAKHVQQRLKLGRVAPELLAEYRAEEIDLECLIAFTITDDHERQLSVYQSLSGWQKENARHIRGCLTDAMVSGKDKLANFVGIEAYQAAGGKVKADLFGEDVYLESPALLNRLAGEKLEAEAEKLRQDGWGWVEINFDRDYEFINKCGRIEPTPIDAPAELVAELEEAEAEQTRIAKQIDAAYEANDQDDALIESLEKQATAIEEKVEQISEKLESFVDFDPDQKKLAGCYVFINGPQLDIKKGLVRPEDKKAVAKALSGEAADASDDNEPADKPKGMPESLKRDLETYRLGVAQVELASHPAIAFDLLVFKVARNALTMRSPNDGPDVVFSRNFAGSASAEAREFLTSQMQSVAKTLPVGWMKHGSEVEQFLAFRDLPEAQKHILLAYCVGLTLKPKLAPAEDKEPTAYDIALSQTGVEVADYWRPTRENYLSRITKDQLLALGEEMLGAEWAIHRRESKKAQLVDQLHKAFEEPEKHGKTPEQIAALESWLPTGMAFGAMPDPEQAKAKKGKKAA